MVCEAPGVPRAGRRGGVKPACQLGAGDIPGVIDRGGAGRSGMAGRNHTTRLGGLPRRTWTALGLGATFASALLGPGRWRVARSPQSMAPQGTPTSASHWNRGAIVLLVLVSLATVRVLLTFRPGTLARETVQLGADRVVVTVYHRDSVICASARQKVGLFHNGWYEFQSPMPLAQLDSDPIKIEALEDEPSILVRIGDRAFSLGRLQVQSSGSR